MAGAYSFVSVPKKGNGAGNPSGKKSYIILFKWDDVKDFAKDEKGVLVSKFAMQEEAKPVAIYATDSSINIYHTMEGDDDARGYIHHVDAEIPGYSLEYAEFSANNSNENLGAIVIDCNPSVANCKIAGTPCTPLKITKNDTEDSKDNNKATLNLASSLRSPAGIGYIPKSLIPDIDDAGILATLGLKTTGSGL